MAQALHLAGNELAVLGSLTVVRDLRHADLSDGLSDCPALRGQHIGLPQLRDDIFGRVPLLVRSSSIPLKSHT